MTTAAGLALEARNFINQYGVITRFKHYSGIFTTGSYDDDTSLVYVDAGSIIWTTGLQQPLDRSRGSVDSFMVEQGLLLEQDSKMYVAATVPTSGMVKIGIGSPPSQEYFIVDNGVISWDINGSAIYKKIYVRHLPGGSILG